MHPECPIEQTFRSDDPSVQQQLMQHAWQRTAAPEQALLVADYNGLRVLGHSERALNRVAKALRHRFGAGLVVDTPLVRYSFGVPVLEPYMTVLINGPVRDLAMVQEDLASRRGRIVRLSEQETFVLEAEAPLAALLGYEEWLQDLFAEDWDRSYVGLWLSRYVAIDGNGPQAA
jgi:hypothetical protein